jgi:aryl-alcohol dehydrogenase-like predicted oxidoreductase
MNERGYRALAALDAIATAREVNVAAAALAWLLAKPTITSPIIGANTPFQLAELLPATALELSAGDVRLLDDASG